MMRSTPTPTEATAMMTFLFELSAFEDRGEI
jgi:hypothetical protein